MRGGIAILLAALACLGCNEGLGIQGDGRTDPAADVYIEPMPDAVATADADGDTITDGDEGGLHAGWPVDTDGDRVPDYLDLDSDGDTILDQDEAGDGDLATPPVDTDSDAVPDFQDLDSDCDTIPDDVEAGDNTVSTPPVDTDSDDVPDFIDPDSDGDGLTDRYEIEHDLDHLDKDSDHDGASDFLETAVGTDPLDPTRTPLVEGDFVFVMPYNDPAAPPDPPLEPEPALDHLVFSAEHGMVDVFFAIDTSGSMDGEINNLRTSIASTVVPGILAEHPATWFGVGRLEDCATCAHNMTMIQEMTDDIPAVEASLTGWSTCGGHVPNTQFLYALATGDVAPFLGWGGVTPTTWTCTPPGSLGWACFRPDAQPVVMLFGDESFSDGFSSCSPSYNHDQAITALNDIGARFIGVNSGITSTSAHADMVTIAVGTGSVDSSGSPLVFDIAPDGSGLGGQVVDAVEILASEPEMEITTWARDDLSDPVDAVSDFIDYIGASITGGWADRRDPSVICVGGLEVADLDEPLDGRVDTFTAVVGGTAVCFDIFVEQNWSVPATDEPGIYLAEIDVVGGGEVLETRTVYFVVPGLGGVTDVDCAE